MVEEVIALLRCGPNRTYVDATLGGGGHSLEILKRTEPDGRVIGIEWDEEAILEAKKCWPFGEREVFREIFVCPASEEWRLNRSWNPTFPLSPSS
jgi:16S rRNA (cytosine1402-N4)-methyltransferase